MSSSCCSTPRKSWNLSAIKLPLEKPVPSDSKISKSVQGKPISELCDIVGIKDYEQYGRYKAKVLTHVSECTADMKQRGNYVVVTGITPTSFGEGKSTTTIGLVQALTAELKLNSFACIRQPSQGPTFGLKGGAAGGGYSQVWPMDEFNLHFTGDIHAVTAANNLIVAAIDARMFHEATQNDEDLFRRLCSMPSAGLSFNDLQKKRLEKLGIATNKNPADLSQEERHKFARLNLDPKSVTVNRVIDTNDRFLRKITIGQAPTEKNRTRETKFTISVASELMAILALGTDLADICRRVGSLVVGFSSSNIHPTSKNPPLAAPVTCDDLCVTGAVCSLLKDAVYPSLIQTLEGTPVLVHCGPFANVAHGNSSIIADKIALDLVGREGFVVTEAGFASDVGFEKFMDIKCRYSKLKPDCAVLVATVRALKEHGGEFKSLDRGCNNLVAHINNIRNNFQVPVVVAINKFTDDTDADLEQVKSRALAAGATECRICDNWTRGGQGAVELAKGVVDTCKKSRARELGAGLAPKLLYEDDAGLSVVDKIKLVATRVYLAKYVDIPDRVVDKIKLLEANGFGQLPICIAKTHLSISHDPKVKGVPGEYTFPIVDIEVSAGAGFLYALAGDISTMPGLPTRPAFFDIHLDPVSGQVEGLF